jgi:MYXO-CTERM domain-containing protein
MKRRRMGTLITAVLCTSTLGISSAAFAQAPCGDDACEPGFECEVAEAPCTGTCYEAEDGDVVCEEECSSQLYYYCAPKPCQADADCGGVMVCNTFESTECSGSVAVDCDDDGNDCEETKEESTCTTSEYKQCAYRHELPCESDAQCGEGFTCVEAESCWCTGSSGEANEDSDDRPNSDDTAEANDETDDADPQPSTEACGCEPSGEKYCQVTPIECQVDSDCPSGWSCAPGSQSCWGDENGVVGCETSPSACRPPGGSTGSVGGEAGEPTTGTDDGGEDEWDEEDESGPKNNDTTDELPVEDDTGSPHADSLGIWALFGCSVQHASGTSDSGVFTWLAAGVGLAALRRRWSR